MKKIAIISDIHGNLEALKTVLNDIKEKNIDEIICLGDIVAKGTHPNECIDLIRKHCHVVLKGNTDRFISEETDKSNTNDLTHKRWKWNRDLVTKENLLYLKSLPFSYEFYLEDQLVRMFHATPTKDDCIVSQLTSIDIKKTQFEPSNHTSNKKADIVFYGHTHIQLMERLYCRTLINVGSVGNSLDLIRDLDFDSNVAQTTQAHYVILESNNHTLNIQFVSVPYDINKELEDVEKNLESQAYILELTKEIYHDFALLKDKLK